MRLRLQHYLLLSLLFIAAGVRAETGYDLWLRYASVSESYATDIASTVHSIHASHSSPTVDAAVDELVRGIRGMTERVPQTGEPGASIVLRTPQTSELVASLDLPFDEIGDEGFVVRHVDGTLVIAANRDIGLLYGAFALLRRLQMETPLDELDEVSAPAMQLRLLNHWDNLSGFVERGYAGASLWDWHRLPEYKDPRYTDYARANASLGINGTVLNNVNANASILTPLYLEKVASIADALRPWGIRVYLSARFSAPVEIGGLTTADPLDEDVQQWWAAKVAEIYELIPDFGGFLVKANSEGQPGPQDYDRTHADGANMLADALAPHGGVVMWRAFVYSADVKVDRVRQAYDEFVPLDGTFRDNVLVQAKNGPLDFQPREPFHPLFGGMTQTPLMMEFQVTKEYLGFASHLAYLGTLWEEVLQSDTYAQGPGSTVARVIDGTIDGHALTGIAGVSNIGADINWSGSVFAQSNWYAYGRFAWNPDASAATVAEEWVRQTFSNDPRFIAPVVDMMMASREAVVNYMTPLGLTHLMATGHHYGPGPWVDDLGRDDWNPYYYHRADKNGIGFDRSERGSGAADQYFEPLSAIYGNVKATPDNLLLWFHRVDWDHETGAGLPVWESLLRHYDRGVETVSRFRDTWAGLGEFVDPERFEETTAFLEIQEREARWWRDASIAYFQSVSGLPLPDGVRPPEHELEVYKAIEFPHLEGY